MREKTRIRERGFTLIELMVVIVIIGMLAAIITPRYMERVAQGRITQTKNQIRMLEGALKLFYLDNGFYPSTEQGLDALINQPTAGRIPTNYKPRGYLETEEIPKDAWGNEYIYRSPATNERFDYEVISLGADGLEGGEGENADIVSWSIQ
ncbi:MAG: type II secretion system major pseudopilin GspG [Candidatus Abyssubacteria bacterium]